MRGIAQDLNFAVRLWRKHPGFAGAAVFALALGIGANTAIFSVVNAVLLRPLPYADSDRLVLVQDTNPQDAAVFASYLNFLDWREQNQVFEQLSAFRMLTFNLTQGGEPERLSGRQVSADFFPLLRAQPALGRAFLAAEDRPGADPVILLSHDLWRRRFGANPQIVGQAITLDNRAFTVLGVMPAGFQFGGETDVWVPIGQWAGQGGWEQRDFRPGTRVYARLKPGVTLEQAQANMREIARQLAAQYPEANANHSVAVRSLYEVTVGEMRPALLMLLGAVGFVLLIACANVANLLLARAATRQKEFAIRAALGASRARVVRQLLTESLLLALLGGTLGLLLAVWGVDLLVAISPGSIPRATEIGIDARVFGFAAALALLTGIGFGLAPAWQASKTDLQDALKEGGKDASAGIGNRLRKILIVAEVALALVLLVGAGLLVKSFVRLSAVDLGFEPAQVLTMRLSLPQGRYAEDYQVTGFYRQLLERVGSLPGAQSVAVANDLPVGGGGWRIGVAIPGRPAPSPGEDLTALNWGIASPDFFRVMHVPLVAGRAFAESDSADAPPVVMVDEPLARRLFGTSENAVGQPILFGSSTRPREIIGVVGQIRNHEAGAASRMKIYTPYSQTTLRTAYLTVRAQAADPATLTTAVTNEVRALDRDLPVFNVRTMEEVVAAQIAPQRLTTSLLGLFSAVALALAGVGVFGVMSYTVAQRTREIGVRLALGAQPADIFRLVVGQGMALVLVGIALGLAIAVAMTRLLTHMLYGVSATDPATFAGVALLLTGVAFVACYIPARRATRVDPLVALRYE